MLHKQKESWSEGPHGYAVLAGGLAASGETGRGCLMPAPSSPAMMNQFM